jgi:hypothetical protein
VLSDGPERRSRIALLRDAHMTMETALNILALPIPEGRV